MGAVYLEDMADVLRAAGLEVVELDGWQRRARSTGGYDGGPACLMLHHTASAGDGAADAQYCTYSSPDRPVCNLVLGRDAVVYVCAGGATNCNGKGGPYTLADGRVIPADQMNLWAIALEMSNNGVGMAYPAAMVDAMFAVWLALAAAYWGGRVDLAAQHVDWAPGRKIDPATGAAVQGPWRPSTTNSSGSWRLADAVAEAQRRQADEFLPSWEDDMTTPANVYLGDELHVFTRGDDQALWHQWYAKGRWELESLGGSIAASPAAAATMSGGAWRVDVTAEGTDGCLWQIWYDGARWSGWVNLGPWPGGGG